MSDSIQDDDNAEKQSTDVEISFDAVDLMLEGNLQAQINYSMVKGIASALDEKAQILIQAEESFEPKEDESFAQVAMPEIEAMAQAITSGCVDFSKFVSGKRVKRQRLPGKNLKMLRVKLLVKCPMETHLRSLGMEIVY